MIAINLTFKKEKIPQVKTKHLPRITRPADYQFANSDPNFF